MKRVQIGKHPYAFNINVKFGTLQEMLDNAKSCKLWDGYQINLGGTFNKEMSERCGSRASFLEIGVQLELKDYSKPVTEENIETAYAISFCHWEGVYWKCSYFDDEIKNGLYPVSADWDGKTFIERGDFDENHRFIPRYELTDTFRF